MPPKPSSLFQVPLLEARGSTPIWAHIAWNWALQGMRPEQRRGASSTAATNSAQQIHTGACKWGVRWQIQGDAPHLNSGLLRMSDLCRSANSSSRSLNSDICPRITAACVSATASPTARNWPCG